MEELRGSVPMHRERRRGISSDRWKAAGDRQYTGRDVAGSGGHGVGVVCAHVNKAGVLPYMRQSDGYYKSLL